MPTWSCNKRNCERTMRQRIRAAKVAAVLSACIFLSSCTMLYTREYVAEPAQELSASETESVYRAFRDFLVSRGLKPLEDGAIADPNRIAFRVAGSMAGALLRHDWEDILELTYAGERDFRLRLIRIIHHRADFTDAYLKQFVEQTEKSIREATSKSINLKLVPRKNSGSAQ